MGLENSEEIYLVKKGEEFLKKVLEAQQCLSQWWTND